MSLASSFWDGKSYAVVGVRAPGRRLIKEFVKSLEAAGKSLWLVDEDTAPFDGREVHAGFEGAPGDLDGALIVCAPEQAASAVGACVDARIPKLWLDTRGDSSVAADAALEAGLPCVVEACPLTTIPGAMWLHRAHGCVATWMGRIREVHPGDEAR
ncbi:MAG TPA: CoA-binding protein [Armatimonadota bacterium]|jgi:predicted CoA-binding protein|nr:CoA-binding protein [Armatimonadota bacterium]